jgi:hypothetical protein
MDIFFLLVGSFLRTVDPLSEYFIAPGQNKADNQK